MGITMILLIGGCFFLAVFLIAAVGLVYYLEKGRSREGND